MDRQELIAQYEQALMTAKGEEKLRCHILAIEKKIEELKNDDYHETVFDQVWVQYFNKNVKKQPLIEYDK